MLALISIREKCYYNFLDSAQFCVSGEAIVMAQSLIQRDKAALYVRIVSAAPQNEERRMVGLTGTQVLYVDKIIKPSHKKKLKELLDLSFRRSS